MDARDKPLLIGSVKTNIGHTAAAAGVAGLIKTVLALRHRQIPVQLHLHTPNPHIAWNELPVRVVTDLTPWPSADGPRIAGLSGFGFSGTNAHAVLEEAPDSSTETSYVERPLHVYTLSAKSENALRELAGRHRTMLMSGPAEALPDIAFTANAGRAHWSHRLVVTAETCEQVRDSLDAFVKGHRATRMKTGRIEGVDRPKVAFVFTDQGSQYAGMGCRLYETQPTFRHTLNRCNDILRPHLDIPLLDLLHSEPGGLAAARLDQTEYAQPALFALEYSLAEMWRSWGIECSAAVGHGIGEFVAACLAGVLSLADALKLVVARGRFMRALPPEGGTAAVSAEETHGSDALARFEQLASEIRYSPPQITFVSTDTGRPVTSRELPGAAYGPPRQQSRSVRCCSGFASRPRLRNLPGDWPRSEPGGLECRAVSWGVLVAIPATRAG